MAHEAAGGAVEAAGRAAGGCGTGVALSLTCSPPDGAIGGDVRPWKYGLVGGLFGVLFPAAAWTLELGDPRGWTSADVSAMHLANPLHWIIDTAPLVLALFSTPIGVWRRRQRVAQYEHDFLETVLGTVDGVVLLFDADGRIWHANRASQRILGCSTTEICGRVLWDFVGDEDAAAVRDRCLRDGTLEAPCHLESVCTLPRGDRRRLAWSITPVPDSARRARLFVATGIDVTERHQLNERLAYQASHDPMTGLANRTLLLAATQRSLETQPADTCLLFVDLDGFKAINDRHGHATGDRVLKAVAQVLLRSTRGIDTVARLGGDEFAVLLERTATVEQAAIVAQRVLAELAVPIVLADLELRVGASIGAALSEGETSADALLCRADAAMYFAKRAGGGRWVVDDGERHAVGPPPGRDPELRLAADHGELVLT